MSPLTSLSPHRAVVAVLATACAFLPLAAPALASEPAGTFRAATQGHPEQISFADFAEKFPAPGSRTGTPQQYALVNTAFRNCVDANPASLDVMGQVYLWGCNGAPQQALTQRYQGVTSFIVTDDGKVLNGFDAPVGTDVGTVARLPVSGEPTNGNQLWTFWDDGTIRNLASGRCLQADPAAPGQPQQLQMFGCTVTPWQQWMVLRVS